MKKLLICSLFAAGNLLVQTAYAHVTLEQATANAGAYHKLTFKIGHGCEGSATTAVKVSIPESVSGAKPMPKAGWKIDTSILPLSVPYNSHGKTISQDVREVSWTGGPLPDAHYDEFAIQVKLPEKAGKVYFKVTQLCEKGRLDWVEIPADGQAGKSLKAPAPVLDVLEKAEAAHQH
ncbi:YcnI family protein [Undibacterium sp. Di27W]|uniref:YcnI family copper-binding membrane protein n=1 Tax=Undibacterium sp. Di27W TaxID=3413036 RepID=UPI003BF3488F